jgi:hypothetical protein
MKRHNCHRFFVIILANMITFSCQTSQSSQNKTNSQFNDPRTSKAVLRFETTKIDFGDVSKDTLLTGKFILRNSGTDTLIINNVQPDCSCTSSHLSKHKIPPKDTASIVLSVSTRDKNGKITLYSTVSTNTETKLFSLRLVANIH